MDFFKKGNAVDLIQLNLKKTFETVFMKIII